MNSLYNLTADYQQVLNLLYDGDVDQQTIMDTLEAIEDAIEEKADGYAMIIKTIDADTEAIDAEIKRLQARKQTLNSRKEWLKSNLEDTMRALGKTKFKTALFSYGIQKNGGKRALILDCPINELPPELQKVTIEANNEAIRNLLIQQGAEDNQYAHLAPQGEHLSIR